MTITQNNGAVMSMEEIFALVQAQKITPVEAAALVQKLQAKGNGQSATLKVTEKGCVQFRGVPGISIRFGLSLYPKALEWILDHADEIRKFMDANKSKLSWGKSAE